MAPSPRLISAPRKSFRGDCTFADMIFVSKNLMKRARKKHNATTTKNSTVPLYGLAHYPFIPKSGPWVWSTTPSHLYFLNTFFVVFSCLFSTYNHHHYTCDLILKSHETHLSLSSGTPRIHLGAQKGQRQGSRKRHSGTQCASNWERCTKLQCPAARE